MRIAVCISGVMSGNSSKNLEHNKRILPDHCDYYLATWNDTRKGIVPEPDFMYEQPKLNYHPILDTEPFPVYKNIKYKEEAKTNIRVKEISSQRTKQILIHNYLLSDIKEDYDIIIRLRFDSLLSTKINWLELIEKSHNEQCAQGFAIRRKRWKDHDKIFDIPHVYMPKDRMISSGGVKESNDWNYGVNDHAIIHPRNLWDCDMVTRYHNEGKLQPGEWGWYQILSEPHGDNHHSYYGGVVLERYA